MPQQDKVHPLFAKKVTIQESWREWLMQWEATQTYEVLLALLDSGFKKFTDPLSIGHDDVSRLVFYLEVADDRFNHNATFSGDYTSYHFGFEEGRSLRRFKSRLCLDLASKAFEVLVENFFVLPLYENCPRFHPDWTRLVMDPRVIVALQDFFAITGTSGWLRVRNQPPSSMISESAKGCTSFLVNWAKFLWDWKPLYPVSVLENYSGANPEISRMAECFRSVRTLRPWMIKVLYGIGHLGVLNDSAEDLDEPCIQALTEIAMSQDLVSSRHSVNDKRKVKTLDEACFAGSRAAWLLKRHELCRAERRRLGAVMEAEEALQKAKANLQRISEG